MRPTDVTDPAHQPMSLIDTDELQSAFRNFTGHDLDATSLAR